MTSNPPRNRGRWSLDFTRRNPNSTVYNSIQHDSTVTSSDLPDPPGYSMSIPSIEEPLRQNNSSLQASEQEVLRSGLRNKRLWHMALGPLLQVPWMLFTMWLSGNDISIYSIMTVSGGLWGPVETLLSINSTFKAMDGNKSTGDNFLQKIVYILGNLVGIALAIYKFLSMGIIPSYDSDWLAFADPVQRAEWAYV